MPDNLPREIEASVARLQSFIDEELIPRERELGEATEIPDSIAMAVRAASKVAGFFGKTQPAEFGGQPAGVLELTALREHLAAANTRLSNLVFGPGPGFLHQAEGVLKEKYLLPVLGGEKRGAFGFTEPEDAERPTWAVLQDDSLTISGRKSYVTGGATADFVSILVNVEDIGGNKLGTALVVVDRDRPGITIEREFRSMEGGGHVAMCFDEVVVPADCIIGKPGDGMPRALRGIGDTRLLVAAQACGMCRWAIQFAERHLLAPHRSGTPLGDREGVRLRYADMRIDTYAARAALYRTAELAEASPAESQPAEEIMAVKVLATETAGRVVDAAVQLVGGGALVQGHPLERLYRQVRSLRFVEGASDLLRINLAKARLERGQGRL